VKAVPNGPVDGKEYSFGMTVISQWSCKRTESAAAYARQKLQLPVLVGKLDVVNLPDNSFDAVIMWHVLEHLERATHALREVNRVLKPGGIFLVAVPNFGSLEARLTRDKWFHLDVPRHLTHFTGSALASSLAQNLFQIQTASIRSFEYDCFSAMQSFLNRIGLQQNWLYRRLKREPGTVSQGLLHLICLPPAAFAGFAAFIVGGSTMIVYARKI